MGRIIIIRMLVATAVLAFGSGAFAQDVSKTCDVKVQDQMKQQGQLEGQRELELAQRLILKPDSTLEYSCFERVAKNFASADSSGNWPQGDPETLAWNFANFGGGSPSGNISLAINSLVLGAFYPYLRNFGHLFLGGTFDTEGAQFIQDLTQPNSLCNPHYWIWFLAKCVNASSVKAPDGHHLHYFPLSLLASRNVRALPNGQLACEAPQITQRNTMVQDLQTKQDEFPDAESNPPKGVDNASYSQGKKASTGVSPNKKYSELLDPAGGGGCGTPVKTGFKFRAGDGTVLDDMVCIMPGCYANGGACSQ